MPMCMPSSGTGDALRMVQTEEQDHIAANVCAAHHGLAS